MGSGASKGQKTVLSKSVVLKLVKETGFSEPELQYLYLRFKSVSQNSNSLAKKHLEKEDALKSNPFILRVFEVIPKNGVGEVVFDTFAKTAGIFREGNDLKAKLNFIFRLFDKNMDGILDEEEVKIMIHAIRPTVSESDVDSLVKRTMSEVACFSRKSEKDSKIRSEDFVAFATKISGIEKLLNLSLADDVS